ncbi:MAG: hypothetical protein M3357_16325 [Actinomycetota bacterium]|nr:hypothetical protein [Actinomycetota bacterium]
MRAIMIFAGVWLIAKLSRKSVYSALFAVYRHQDVVCRTQARSGAEFSFALYAPTSMSDQRADRRALLGPTMASLSHTPSSGIGIG